MNTEIKGFSKNRYLEYGIGVVIVDYHASEMVNKSIQMLKGIGLFSCFVIVDNSRDFNINKYQISENVYILFNQDNIGYGRAINAGIQYLINHIKIKYVMSINYDIKISADEVIKCVRAIDAKHPISTCIMKKPDDTIDQSFWPIMSYKEYLLLLSLCGSKKIIKKRKDMALKAISLDNKIIECESVHESYMIIDVSFILKYGNVFDEGLFMYCEADAIALKLKKYNKKALCITDAYCYHFHVSKGKGINFNFNYYRSAKYILKKYFKTHFIALVIFNIFYCFSIIERIVVIIGVKTKRLINYLHGKKI